MVFQRIDRVVRRADQHDLHLPHDAAARHVVAGQQCVALLPDSLRRLGIEQPVADTKRPFEFQVGPVIQRIAERFGHNLGPLLELLPVAGVAGAIAFRHAGRAHRPPFVMIAVEPDLRQVGEAVVLGNLPRRQVAVVVDDRQITGELVIKLDRAVVLQKKVFGDEDVVHIQVSGQRRIGRSELGNTLSQNAPNQFR